MNLPTIHDFGAKRPAQKNVAPYRKVARELLENRGLSRTPLTPVQASFVVSGDPLLKEATELSGRWDRLVRKDMDIIKPDGRVTMDELALYLYRLDHTIAETADDQIISLDEVEMGLGLSAKNYIAEEGERVELPESWLDRLKSVLKSNNFTQTGEWDLSGISGNLTGEDLARTGRTELRGAEKAIQLARRWDAIKAAFPDKEKVYRQLLWIFNHTRNMPVPGPLFINDQVVNPVTIPSREDERLAVAHPKNRGFHQISIHQQHEVAPGETHKPDILHSIDTYGYGAPTPGGPSGETELFRKDRTFTLDERTDGLSLVREQSQGSYRLKNLDSYRTPHLYTSPALSQLIDKLENTVKQNEFGLADQLEAFHQALGSAQSAEEIFQASTPVAEILSRLMNLSSKERPLSYILDKASQEAAGHYVPDKHLVVLDRDYINTLLLRPDLKQDSLFLLITSLITHEFTHAWQYLKIDEYHKNPEKLSPEDQARIQDYLDNTRFHHGMDGVALIHRDYYFLQPEEGDAERAAQSFTAAAQSLVEERTQSPMQAVEFPVFPTHLPLDYRHPL